jgi:enoyl-CoA hydratase/carnithine racemase
MSETRTDLDYETRDAVAWIVIDREKYQNSISPRAIDLFLAYLDRAEADPGVRALCLTARGERVFCSGADLGGVFASAGDEQERLFSRYAALLAKLTRFPKPTVARVNGHCMAGGLGFMLACDLVVAADDARFGAPEVSVGLFPLMIGALIFRNVPRKKAMELILTARKITAAQALDMGLVTRVCPRSELDGETGSLLQDLTSRSPIGIRLGKQAFAAVEGMDLEPALTSLAQALRAVAATRDAAEGIRAFLEKRPPVFTGD